ncbi:hypothetical protein CWO89_11560 [Bradyrhizobium sp. Leo170]|nr:hypothetical protein CWO89_11560 [Bradyrhizobium sp. Leo170]
MYSQLKIVKYHVPPPRLLRVRPIYCISAHRQQDVVCGNASVERVPEEPTGIAQVPHLLDLNISSPVAGSLELFHQVANGVRQVHGNLRSQSFSGIQ